MLKLCVSSISTGSVVLPFDCAILLEEEYETSLVCAGSASGAVDVGSSSGNLCVLILSVSLVEGLDLSVVKLGVYLNRV